MKSGPRLWICFVAVQFIALFSVANLCYPAFEDLGIGARVLGMGNAFVGLADDINASYYNPAGIAQLQKIEFQTMYAGHYLGLNESIGDWLVGYAQNLNEEFGAIGFGYLERRVSDLYKEGTIILSYAKRFKGEKLSLGASLKYRYKSYKVEYNFQDQSQLDPVFLGGNSAGGVCIDLGLLYQPVSAFSFGISALDINQPDISLLRGDPVPMSFRIGFSYKFGQGKNYALNMDGLYRDQDYSLNLGIENWITLKMVDIEFGEVSKHKNKIGWRTGFEMGTNECRNLSMGASYRIDSPDLQFDYAFIYPFSGIKSTYGTHRIAMIIRL